MIETIRKKTQKLREKVFLNKIDNNQLINDLGEIEILLLKAMESGFSTSRGKFTCRAKFCARHDVDKMRNIINKIARNAMNISDSLPH